MTIRLIGKTLVVWVGILFLAVANGVLREAVLIPGIGPTPGLFLSGILLSVLIFGVTYLTLPWIEAQNTKQLAAIGLGWLGLTLVFEFSFGLLQGKPLTVLLAAYTFKGGNIWSLVLLVTATAPYLAAKIRDWSSCR